MGLEHSGMSRHCDRKTLSEEATSVRIFTSSSEGQVFRSKVRSEEVFMMILPHIRDMGGFRQKSASGFLMAEVKKPRTILVGVGLKVKKKIDLVGGRYWPFFELIKDIECG